MISLAFFILIGMSWDIESFRQKVEDQHSFPGYYTFKFIVPHHKRDIVLAFLPEGEISFKESSNGNYVSVTARIKLQTSQQVLDVYIEANDVEGLIAL